MRTALASLTPEHRHQASNAIARALESLLATQTGRLAAFWPRSDEPDVTALLPRLAAAGWTIALPWFETDDSVFELRAWTPKTAVQPGPFGIGMPATRQHNPITPSVTHVLVPGLAFDQQGTRLGRGRGMYDRFLKNADAAVRIGVCFSCQRVASVPRTEHDVRMHLVVDEDGVRSVVQP